MGWLSILGPSHDVPRRPNPYWLTLGVAKLRRRALIIISILVSASAVSGLLILTIGLPSSSCANKPGTAHTFTIIADLDGFNGSRNRPTPWPVMNAQRCDTVAIVFVNADTQAHGLAVDFYSIRGVAPHGGETQTLSFTATKPGQFRVFCNIFCTVHIFMQDGLLNVR